MKKLLSITLAIMMTFLSCQMVFANDNEMSMYEFLNIPNGTVKGITVTNKDFKRTNIDSNLFDKFFFY